MNEQPRDVTLPSISDYYSFTQLRADRWSALRECAESMSVDGVDGRKGERLVARAKELFDSLAPIEIY